MPSDLAAALLTLAAVWFVAVVTPGPNFLAVMGTAATGDRSAAVAAAVGTIVGTSCWGVVGVYGFNAVLAVAPGTFAALKLVGAAYLAWSGIALWRAGNAPAPALAGTPGGLARAFRFGLLTNLANPKTAAFAASLFSVAVPPGAPEWFAPIAIATVVAVSAFWYLPLAMVATTRRAAAVFARARRAGYKIAGTIFVGFAVKLATER